MNRAFLTVDLGFGDAGKGSVVDYLTRAYDAHTVIRYSGGAQAGHRVVTADGREHIFSQFGAGTLAGADSVLSRFMMVEPLALRAEADHLVQLGQSEVMERLRIDAQALVITPFHRAINRLRELARGDNRHGSCGIGVGETMRDRVKHGDRVLRVGDLIEPEVLHQQLRFLRRIARAKLRALAPSLPDSEQVAQEREWLDDPRVIPWMIERYRSIIQPRHIVDASYLQEVLARPGTVLFEAAQGVLLDEWVGFHPYTTWATVTLAQADQLLRDADYGGSVRRIGITRAYATRHGAGPFVTEDAALSAALPDAANGDHHWQQHFRVGWPDLVTLRYARQVAGALDALAITCLDRLDVLPELKVCRAYDRLDHLPIARRPRDLVHQSRLTRRLLACRPLYAPIDSPEQLVERLSTALALPIALRSYGPTAEHKVEGGGAQHRRCASLCEPFARCGISG